MENKKGLPEGMTIEDLTALTESPNARSLISQLQNQHSPQLESAIRQAQAGNFQQVRETLNQYLQSPMGQEMLKKLRGDSNG